MFEKNGAEYRQRRPRTVRCGAVRTVATLLVFLGGVAGEARPAATLQADGEEIARLRAQLQRLEQRIAALEAQLPREERGREAPLSVPAVPAASIAPLPAPVPLRWRADLRYRHERFDVQGASDDRVRDRIRVRAGLSAMVGETLSGELQLGTGGSDPRGSNVTLDGVGSRKEIGLDLGFIEWRPHRALGLTLGKQRQPWIRPGASYLIDTDLTPEGISGAFELGSGWFGHAFHFWLDEREHGIDSTLAGAQVGWRGAPAAAGAITFGAGYYDFGAVAGQALFAPVEFRSFGNTVRAVSAAGRDGCSAAPSLGTTCLAYDYDVLQLFAAAELAVHGQPLTVFADYAQNLRVSAQEVAYSVGATFGNLKRAGGFEIGYLYQIIEKDALLGHFADSDFGDGSTDTRGSVVRFGYGLGSSASLNASWFVNELNVSGRSDGLRRRDYERLQLDVNYRF